jgi:hypothetical protein
VSYSDELAQAHSRGARQLINEHANYLGFMLSPQRRSVPRQRCRPPATAESAS